MSPAAIWSHFLLPLPHHPKNYEYSAGWRHRNPPEWAQPHIQSLPSLREMDFLGEEIYEPVMYSCCCKNVCGQLLRHEKCQRCLPERDRALRLFGRAERGRGWHRWWPVSRKRYLLFLLESQWVKVAMREIGVQLHLAEPRSNHLLKHNVYYNDIKLGIIILLTNHIQIA